MNIPDTTAALEVAESEVSRLRSALAEESSKYEALKAELVHDGRYDRIVALTEALAAAEGQRDRNKSWEALHNAAESRVRELEAAAPTDHDRAVLKAMAALSTEWLRSDWCT